MQVTRDNGGRWTNVTANIPGLPAWGTVRNIEPSRHDAGTAYITVDLHQVNNRDAFVFKTADYGRTWKLINGDLPRRVHSYAHCVRADPIKRGLTWAPRTRCTFRLTTASTGCRCSRDSRTRRALWRESF